MIAQVRADIHEGAAAEMPRDHRQLFRLVKSAIGKLALDQVIFVCNQEMPDMLTLAHCRNCTAQQKVRICLAPIERNSRKAALPRVLEHHRAHAALREPAPHRAKEAADHAANPAMRRSAILLRRIFRPGVETRFAMLDILAEPESEKPQKHE